jgi:hypothetical protein
MDRLRHTARKSVIPYLPSRLAERPLRRPVTVQSSHLERLHHRLHEEQERWWQELEQQGSSFSLQQDRVCEELLPCAPTGGAPCTTTERPSRWSSCWRRPRRRRWRQQLKLQHQHFSRPGAGRMGCSTHHSQRRSRVSLSRRARHPAMPGTRPAYLVHLVSQCGLPAQSRGLPGPLGGDLFGAPSGEQSLGCRGLFRALFYLWAGLSWGCDGTSQVIRPTYSCPCPTDLRQPCRCTWSLVKFGICILFLSQERFTRHADITTQRRNENEEVVTITYFI